jgi:hypothetical protein
VVRATKDLIATARHNNCADVLRGTSVLEEFYTMLPTDGFIAFEAARVGLSEQMEAEVSEDALAQCIFTLVGQRRVDWLPDDRQIRRALPDNNKSLPWPISCERDLEQWVERYLWQRARRFYDPPPNSVSVIVENTARVNSGRGRWSRPDLSMACVGRYRYQPVPIFDLFTFELKLPRECTMLAVHEALSHSACSNYPYLCVYLPDTKERDVEIARAHLPDMLEQARRHGVGVIRFSDPRDPETYERIIDARRHGAPPAKIDSFIDERFNRINGLALSRWVKQ